MYVALSFNIGDSGACVDEFSMCAIKCPQTLNISPRFSVFKFSSNQHLYHDTMQLSCVVVQWPWPCGRMELLIHVDHVQHQLSIVLVSDE